MCYPDIRLKVNKNPHYIRQSGSDSNFVRTEYKPTAFLLNHSSVQMPTPVDYLATYVNTYISHGSFVP